MIRPTSNNLSHIPEKLMSLAFILAFLIMASCSSDDSAIKIEDQNSEHPKDSILDPDPDPDSAVLTDAFTGSGDLLDYVTNNASALPETARVEGRYRAELTDNQGNVTLHYNGQQGRLDAKLVSFPFEFIARNIGIGTLEDSQVAPAPNGSPYIFAGVQVHVEDFASINSSHVVVGHRGGTSFTIEGKNTLNGSSSVNDIGSDTAPEGKADIRIVGTTDKTLTVYWQLPNLEFEAVDDNWTLYRNTGLLPGTEPAYGENVYVGLITYASGSNGVPFVGTCDAIQIK